MKLEYNWTREDLKKELISKRYLFNVIFFILSIICYILLMFTGLKSDLFDNKIIFIGILIFAFAVALFLFLITKIYVYWSLRKNDKNTSNAYGTYYVEVTDKDIKVTINETKILYKWSDINKFKIKKNAFFINTKEDKLGLLFKKKILGEEKYNQLLTMVKKYC